MRERLVAPLFGSFVADQMTGDKLPVIAIMTAFSPPYLKIFGGALKSRGKTLDVVAEFEPSMTDFRSILIKLKKQVPHDVMMIATPLNASHILTQAAELGIHANWYNIGVEGPELLALSKTVAKGLRYPYSFDCNSDSQKILSFCKKYHARYGVEPDAIAANTYDSVMLLNRCLKLVGTKVEVVSTCLYSTTNYQGVSGQFSIDNRGDATRKLMVKELH